MQINWGVIAEVAVPAIIAGAGAAIAVLRVWGKAWVKHQFDHVLADINAEHQTTLAALASKLNRQADQISALQSGALATMISRHEALDSRRREAVARVWQAATKMNALGHILPMVGAMVVVYKDLEGLPAADRDKIAATSKTLGSAVNDKEITSIFEDAQYEQLYLDAYTWQIFASMKNIFVYARLQMSMMEGGNNPLQINISETILNPLCEILPERKDYIIKEGESGAYNLTSQLYTKLWQQLRLVLDGEEADKKILKSTESLMAASYQTQLQLGAESLLPEAVQQQIEKVKPVP